MNKQKYKKMPFFGNKKAYFSERFFLKQVSFCLIRTRTHFKAILSHFTPPTDNLSKDRTNTLQQALFTHFFLTQKRRIPLVYAFITLTRISILILLQYIQSPQGHSLVVFSQPLQNVQEPLQ